MAIDTTLNYDERFDKIDTQFQQMGDQFDKFAATMVKGFDQIDKTLDAKAGKADLQRIYDLLDKIV